MQRRIYNKIMETLVGPNRRILVIQGPRGSGKTHLINQLRHDLQAEGKKISYYNVKRSRISPVVVNPSLFANHLLQTFAPTVEDRLYLFLDEIMLLREPEQYIEQLDELLGDRARIVTSASCIYRFNDAKWKMSPEVVTLLPLSWHEYLTGLHIIDHQKLVNLDDHDALRELHQRLTGQLNGHLIDYLNWGGYIASAEAKSMAEKAEALNEAIHDYLDKDINSIINFDQQERYVAFLRYLAEHVGEQLNLNTLRAELEMHLATLEKCLVVARKTFLFSYIKPFFTDPKREMSKMRQPYALDLGTLSILRGETFTHATHPPVCSEEKLKNFICNELAHQVGKRNVFFYRTISKAGVDFVAVVGEKLYPIDIVFGKQNVRTSAPMKNFIKKYHNRIGKAIIVTLDQYGRNEDALIIPASVLPFVKLAS